MFPKEGGTFAGLEPSPILVLTGTIGLNVTFYAGPTLLNGIDVYTARHRDGSGDGTRHPPAPKFSSFPRVVLIILTQVFYLSR